MQRRAFVTHHGSLILSTTLLSPALALAQAKAPLAGTDFMTLDRPAPVETPAGKIELLEFFWYSCPHCHAFEPVLSAWVQQLPKDVVFKRVPVNFRDGFEPQQRLFYALEALNLLDTLHTRVFAAIHVEKQNLSQAAAITDWVVKQGVDRARFVEQFNSFSVSAKAKRAKQLQEAYKVDGVPALGIAGRYYTDGALAQSMNRVLQVTDYLIDQIRRQP
ncbi:MAG: thiol:disulfide interchange protein DsbA/DsbL [Rhodoferax sp.]|uniref:thiol:disulfide interchange protein DsbA/DsbL n=1 Tax=Rhodoferax sp. TaxID=50421 RepID=UPI002735C5C5|nr:thiol:disulfide interchange protein DsbA/DsbL [Rhodoferax sp.]MDP2679906.1 thiol:disulfide interchange protein DsbA/DsbL [Rhodoferax sp.]